MKTLPPALQCTSNFKTFVGDIPSGGDSFIIVIFEVSSIFEISKKDHRVRLIENFLDFEKGYV